MAQDGGYVFWEQDGMSLRLFPTNDELNQAFSEAVLKVTGTTTLPAGPINSDGYSFIRAGIPLATLGTYDRKLRGRGLHLPSDNLSRVKLPRLLEGVEILTQFISSYDEK